LTTYIQIYDIISEQAPYIRNPQNQYMSIDNHSSNDNYNTVFSKQKKQIRKMQNLIASILKQRKPYIRKTQNLIASILKQKKQKTNRTQNI
jgi:hypothetical protein